MEKYCLTYFLVKFDNKNFDIKDFADSLGFDVKYLEYWGTEETIEIGRNEIYKDNINDMIRESIKDLIGKEDILLKLKKKYNLKYVIERVPVLNSKKEHNQILSLSDDIIEFMYKSGTSDDLDYVIY